MAVTDRPSRSRSRSRSRSPAPPSAAAEDTQDAAQGSLEGPLKRSRASLALSRAVTAAGPLAAEDTFGTPGAAGAEVDAAAPAAAADPSPAPSSAQSREELRPSFRGAELLITFVPFPRAVYLLRRTFKKMGARLGEGPAGGFVGWEMRYRWREEPKEVFLSVRFETLAALEQSRQTLKETLDDATARGWILEILEVTLARGKGMLALWDFAL